MNLPLEHEPDDWVYTISIRLRYFGHLPRLQHLHGTEIDRVPPSQEAIDRELQRLAGPVVVILDVDADDDTVMYTLGDPPAPVRRETHALDPATCAARQRVRRRDTEIALLEAEPPTHETRASEDVTVEGPKVVNGRICNTG